MIESLLESLAKGRDVSFDQMRAVTVSIMQGGCNDDQIARLLTSLAAKGETVDEVAGAAAAMGACGYFLSARAVFIVTVLLLVPALMALRTIREAEIDPERAHGASPRRPPRPPAKPGSLMQSRPLLVFACCLLLFYLANAAMLPLMGSVVTMRSARWATLSTKSKAHIRSWFSRKTN